MQKRTVNKFVGPDHSAPIWYSAKSKQDDLPAEGGQTSQDKSDENSADAATGTGNELSVEVWLFGLLSTLSEERPLTLRLASDATPMDVLDGLEKRFDSEILAHIKDPVSGILPCCRIFVDGESFEDVRAPIAVNQDGATIELIVMKGFEGG